VIPHLRELNINRAGQVTLWPPPQLESLSLHARQADLSALEGHPTLWELTLTDLPVRVDLPATLPALTRLDVSAAIIDDMDALAELDIRVLTLNAEQWQRLRTNDRLPGNLAGAQLSTSVPLTQAADWSSWLHDVAGPAHRT
jgi:hypothetical protein